MRRILLSILALGLIVCVLRWMDSVVGDQARKGMELGEAEWIWAAGSEEMQVGPQAFLAVRDFDVEAIPKLATLWIAAEEEYLVDLNGKTLGGGRKRSPIELDGYRVGDLLELGGNRITVELRSSKGAGGCLVYLEVPGGPPLLQSDLAWRIFRGHVAGLKRGLVTLGQGEEAWSWGRPSVGRWGIPERGALRNPQQTSLGETSLLHSEILGEPGMSRKERLEKGGGPIVTFDFGSPVTGVVHLALSGENELHALLYLGQEVPPDPRNERPAAYVISVPGSPTWRDTVARRFRYVTVVGTNQRIRALAAELDETFSSGDISPSQGKKGILGIDPPLLGSPMENEIWRELESGEGAP